MEDYRVLKDVDVTEEIGPGIINHLALAKKPSEITFKVSDVEIASEFPKNRVPVYDALKRQLGKGSKIESWSQAISTEVKKGKTVLACYGGNPLVSTVGQCFDEHRPLVLSPDMIWLTILQGFANHINENSETYRKRFVDFEGKEKIVVRRDDFIKGCIENPWEEVFPAFTSKIKEYIGEQNYEMVVGDFSTTTSIEKAAYEVALLDIVQSYFSLEFHTKCGIPEITVEGSKEDWEKILTKTEALSEFDLEWWTDGLMPVLEQFVSVSDQKIDGEFWRSFYKKNSGSGGPYISGYILNLFPYLKRGGKKVKNAFLDRTEDKNRYFGGATEENFPSGLSSAPYLWKYLGQKFNMKFVAGFYGSEHNPETKALRPAIGWAITDEGEIEGKIVE